MELKEYKAKTLDEAITAASVDLGVTSSELYYEVTDKGSNGILGLGKKDTTIVACKLSDKEAVENETTIIEKQEIKEEIQENIIENIEKEAEDVVEKTEEKEHQKADSDLVISTAKEFLSQVFSIMELEVSYDCKFSDDNNTLSIDLEGENMGIIIGKRGQTLDSLQYLVNLVVNKKSEPYIRVKLDTEDYRRRRKETLENLAKNIAKKVKRTGESVTLEAMNPYERRTIHYALQKDRYVTTYSEGEEPYRHVVIASKS